MLKGFKDFLMRGNVIDLAVAVVIGAAFSAIVKAFTDNIIQPLINSLGSTNQAEGLGFLIRSGKQNTFMDFGSLITAAINFVIIAAVVYFVIVLPFEKIKALSAKKGDDAAALTEAELLTEIRDLIASQQSGGAGPTAPGAAASGTTTGSTASATDGPGRHEA